MTPKCLITGCDIVYDFGTQHGDLWEVGDCYVFNAVGEPDFSGDSLGDLFFSIHGSQQDNYFARRNVLVVPKSECWLSAEAAAYIERQIR